MIVLKKIYFQRIIGYTQDIQIEIDTGMCIHIKHDYGGESKDFVFNSMPVKTVEGTIRKLGLTVSHLINSGKVVGGYRSVDVGRTRDLQ